MYRSRVSGCGSYLPEKVLSNADLEKLVDTSDQWIRERTGMERRHIAASNECTSDLGLVAAQRALTAAGLEASALDLIIFATVSPDQIMPSTACVLQQKLGCPGVPAFDLSAACSGFLYGLSLADQAVRTGWAKNVLVVGAEVLHNFINYKDRETCILFGDAAGAFVLSRAETDSTGLLQDSFLRAEGALSDLLDIPGGGSKRPPNPESFNQGDHFLRMKGREIFKHAVRVMSSSCELILERNKISIQDVDWLVPHQANKRIMEAVAEKLAFPLTKVVNVVHEMGNTSAATIPVAFDMAVQDGRLKRGDQVLMTAFGAGLTAGSLLLRY